MVGIINDVCKAVNILVRDTRDGRKVLCAWAFEVDVWECNDILIQRDKTTGAYCVIVEVPQWCIEQYNCFVVLATAVDEYNKQAGIDRVGILYRNPALFANCGMLAAGEMLPYKDSSQGVYRDWAYARSLSIDMHNIITKLKKGGDKIDDKTIQESCPST
ncbi:MAG: hypothetical protein WC449_05350 [Candidatus Paceibacterota bacterium]